MADSTVKKEQGTNGYVHSVEAGCQEEDRSVDVISERKKDPVLVLVRLTEQENSSKKNC